MIRRRIEPPSFQRKWRKLLRITLNRQDKAILIQNLKDAQEALEQDKDLDAKFDDHFIGRLQTGEFHLNGKVGDILIKYEKGKDEKGYYVRYTDITNHKFLNKASVILGTLIGLYSRDIISEDDFLNEVDNLYDEFDDQDLD